MKFLFSQSFEEPSPLGEKKSIASWAAARLLQMFFWPDTCFPRCQMQWLSVVGPRKRDGGEEVGCGDV